MQSLHFYLVAFGMVQGIGLREMMRCASSAARAVSGLDARDADREEIVISTLSWPPDPQMPETINLGIS